MARGLVHGRVQMVIMCAEGMYRFVRCIFSSALIPILINLPFLKHSFNKNYTCVTDAVSGTEYSRE